MGSTSKKHKDRDHRDGRESRKRRHKSPTEGCEEESIKEKKHKHHKHKHRKDKYKKKDEDKYNYISDDSDVIEIPADNIDEKHLPTKKQEESSSVISGDSLSVEETNKLRAKLGLKPLDVGSSNVQSTSSTTNTKSKEDKKIKDEWGEFYHKPADNLGTKAKAEKLRTKLAERKQKRELQNKYSSIKTLGESDSEDDASLWVDKNRKTVEAKKEAERRAKILEELDAQFGIGEVIESEKKIREKQQYTSQHLKGLTVQHDINDIAEGKNIILTLKDRDVLEKEDDVLMNVNMTDNERYKTNIENKKKKSVYNQFEDEFDQYGNPIDKSVLSKYDEEINGEKKESFVLGSDISFEARQQQAMNETTRLNLTKMKLERIAESKLKIASEYYNDEELLKFKKPKKKIRKIRPKGKLSSIDSLDKNIDEDIESVGSRRNELKEKDLDIDDIANVESLTDIKIEENDNILEQALHRARKIKQKDNVVAELVKKTILKTEIEEDNIDNGKIVLNSTAEFCRSLGDIPTYGKSGNRDNDDDLDIDFENNIKEDENLDDEDDDVQIIESSGWNSVDINETRTIQETVPQEVQILDEEPDVSKGVAAALKVAISKGYLEKEINNRPSNSKLAHLQAQNYSIEDKVYGEDGERGVRRGERYAGPIMDFKEKESFKPNVKLEYIDDEGHVLNSKEAFRYLSHKFHGKGPGKNKVEKRIKKGVQEQLMKKMSSTDTPLGTLNMLQAKQKESQSPFVVLSGNKQSQNTMISKISRR